MVAATGRNFSKSVAIKMESRVALPDSAETSVETSGKGGINKPYHASDDRMWSPLTRQRLTDTHQASQRASNHSICYAVIHLLQRYIFITTRMSIRFNGGKFIYDEQKKVPYLYRVSAAFDDTRWIQFRRVS